MVRQQRFHLSLELAAGRRRNDETERLHQPARLGHRLITPEPEADGGELD